MPSPVAQFRRSLWSATIALGLLSGCSPNPAPDDQANAALGFEPAEIVPASEIVANADIPGLDPHTLAEAQIEEGIGAGPRCTFRYTSSGKPVLGYKPSPVQDAAAGVVMLNGDLVLLQSEPAQAGSVVLAAQEIRLTLTLDGQEAATSTADQQEATLIFEIGERLRVGYRGYHRCMA